MLQAKACQSKVEIQIVNQGECQNAVEKDKCDTCPQLVDPICGSDNKTYISPCVLNMMNCRRKTKVEMVSSSPCPLNGFIHDQSDNEDYDGDEPSIAPVADDKCAKKCNKNVEPVCVNDHRNFINRCTMEVVTCQENIAVKTVTEGHCVEEEDCDSKGCSLLEDPVCGSNGITYRNDCVLKKLNCEKKLSIAIVSRGNCPESKSDVDPDDDKCRPVCPRHFMPCCGSDGKTYNNDCLMKAATCRDKSITMVHLGACDPDKFQKAGR